jgi:hypothetical protein
VPPRRIRLRDVGFGYGRLREAAVEEATEALADIIRANA